MEQPQEPFETVELPVTDTDKADLHQLYSEPDAEPPGFHPILQVWREVLAPARDEIDTKVTPQWASRIISSYIGLGFEDMVMFRNRYYAKLMEMMAILDEEIATDPECLTYSEAADDARHNAGHYKNLLLDWQLRLLDWEMAWDTMAIHAAVELAAVSEVHKMFFGPNGLTAFLDNIGFEFTEADSAAMQEALQAHRGGDDE